jgi:hypothetical protein
MQATHQAHRSAPGGRLPTIMGTAASKTYSKSHAPAASKLAANQYCAISLGSTDMLRLVHAPPRTEAMLRTAIKDFWTPGIQQVDEIHDAWEYQLVGTPWRANGTTTVTSRRLMCAVLEAMHCAGWVLVTATDLCRDAMDASTFIFRRSEELTGERRRVVALSTHETDKIRIVNAPNGGGIVSSVGQAIRMGWPKGVDREREYGGSYEFKLHGQPWWCNGEDTVPLRQLAMNLIHAMGECGYDPLTCADVSKKPRDSDTFFFVARPKGVPAPNRPLVSISMNSTDLIRLVGSAPRSVWAAIKTAAAHAWPRGIQKESVYARVPELKLKGRPWWADGLDAVHSRALVCQIVSEMERCGWTLLLTADLSRKDSDKSTMIFAQAANPLPSRGWSSAAAPWCLSFNESDLIRVIRAPAGISRCVHQAIAESWPKGVARERTYGESQEFKLHGRPWADQSLMFNTMALAVALLRSIEALGFMLLGSVDNSAKHTGGEGEHHPIDLHSVSQQRCR